MVDMTSLGLFCLNQTSDGFEALDCVLAILDMTSKAIFSLASIRDYDNRYPLLVVYLLRNSLIFSLIFEEWLSKLLAYFTMLVKSRIWHSKLSCFSVLREAVAIALCHYCHLRGL